MKFEMIKTQIEGRMKDELQKIRDEAIDLVLRSLEIDELGLEHFGQRFFISVMNNLSNFDDATISKIIAVVRDRNSYSRGRFAREQQAAYDKLFLTNQENDK